jgi:type IV secretory pathway VirB6-like protein
MNLNVSSMNLNESSMNLNVSSMNLNAHVFDNVFVCSLIRFILFLAQGGLPSAVIYLVFATDGKVGCRWKIVRALVGPCVGSLLGPVCATLPDPRSQCGSSGALLFAHYHDGAAKEMVLGALFGCFLYAYAYLLMYIKRTGAKAHARAEAEAQAKARARAEARAEARAGARERARARAWERVKQMKRNPRQKILR